MNYIYRKSLRGIGKHCPILENCDLSVQGCAKKTLKKGRTLLYIVHTIQCTVYTLYIVHTIQCTVYTLYIVHTIHCTHYTMYTRPTAARYEWEGDRRGRVRVEGCPWETTWWRGCTQCGQLTSQKKYCTLHVIWNCDMIYAAAFLWKIVLLA